MMYISLEEQWNMLKPVWRILLVVMVMQIFGAATYTLYDVKGLLFLNIWYGAAYATPLGYILGLLWHLMAVKNGYSQHKAIILYMAALSLALPVFGYLSRNIWALNLAHQG